MISRRWRWVALVTSALASTSGLAGEVAWRGEFRLGLIAGHGRRLTTEQDAYAGVTAAAEARVDYENWRAWGEVTFDSRLDGAFGTADAEPDFRQLALRYSAGDWEVTLGRQQIVWGRADGFNPTNVLGVRDFGRLAVWDDEFYRGVDAARLDWRFGDGQQVSLYALPHWRRSRLVAGFEQRLAQVPTTRSDAVDEENPGWALRYERLGSGFDGSFTLARVADSSPYLRVDSAGGLERRFGELWLAGADFAWTLYPWVLRGEFAWLEREAGPTAPADEFSAVLAAEREVNEQVNLNLQLIRTRLDDFSTPSQPGVLADLAAVTGLVFHQQRSRYTGASLGLTLRPSNYLGRLETTLLGFRSGEWLLRVRGEYPLGQRGKVELLAEHFDGDRGSTFDGLGDNNGVWLRLSYTWAH